jgi:DNA-binding beta-propeller fold protein YncE
MRTLSVGRGATAVAVAGRTGRIFVTNSQDNSVSVVFS